MVGIIIALSKPEESAGIKTILTRSGYRKFFVCANGAQTITQADSLDYGIVICGYKLQDMMYSQLRENLHSGFEMLVLVSMKNSDDCYGNGISKLTMPLQTSELIKKIGLMTDDILRRKKRSPAPPRKRSEEDLKIINEAKNLLMRKNNLTEEEAHRYIQRVSMESGSDLVETAGKVLTLIG